MKPVVDQLRDSAVDAVRQSGIPTESTRTAEVTAVHASDGTCTVQIGTSTIPRVRIVGFPAPMQFDLVTIQKTAGGWVCLGVLRGSQTRWRVPTLNTPWANYGSGWQTRRYRRVGSLVELQGVMTPTSTITNVNNPWMYQLDVDCWPPSSRAFTQSRNGGTTFYQLTVNAEGVVRMQGPNTVTAGNYVICDVSFSID